ncbi:MAG: hypothetical protein MUP66_00805 [Candidatus Nanohaloarchaeota archaeon QJJ-5]|nr:hypothetical protein [Candidatus Nanohaloarchaeota archaeon QJJ-5]
MARTLHDLNIQSSISSGEDDVATIIQRAETLGIDRIAICEYAHEIDDIDTLKNAIDATDTSIDVHPGVKIRADDDQELHNKLSQFRDEVDVVTVQGGDSDINRAACDDTRVDILSNPEFKRNDSGIDHVIAKKAHNNRVAIEINFGSVLKTYGKLRAQIMAHMRRNIRLADKYEASLIINSGARKIEEMRNPRDMVGLAVSLGMSLSDAFETVEKTPARILNRAKQTEKQERPGLERYDES